MSTLTPKINPAPSEPPAVTIEKAHAIGPGLVVMFTCPTDVKWLNKNGVPDADWRARKVFILRPEAEAAREKRRCTAVGSRPPARPPARPDARARASGSTRG